MLERSPRSFLTASLSPRMTASASVESAGAANDTVAPSSNPIVRLPRKLCRRIAGVPPSDSPPRIYLLERDRFVFHHAGVRASRVDDRPRLVRVSVEVAVAGIHRDHAAGARNFAAQMLELHRSVVDMESVPQHVLHAMQDV